MTGAYQRFGLFVPRLSAIKQKGTVQKMLWKYELACKAEGLSDEEIRKIRKIFRDDQERLRYEKQTRKELGITIISLSSLVNEDSRSEVIEPADPNVDVENEVMHQIEIDMIRDCLSQMKTEDADFLRELYAGRHGVETAMAKKYNLTRYEFRKKHKQLLSQLKEIFISKFGDYFAK